MLIILVRIITALFRAAIIFAILLWPTLILSDTYISDEIGFIIAILVISVIVFCEYAVVVPNLLEFRFSPPYNRLRLSILFFVIFFMLTIYNIGNRENWIIDSAKMFNSIASKLLGDQISPAVFLSNMIIFDSSEMQNKFIILANGTLLMALLCGALVSFYIWVSSWPVANNKHFRIWVDIPTYNALFNDKIRNNLLQNAILSLFFGVGMPYIFPIIFMLFEGWILLTIKYSTLNVFWLILSWALLSSLLIMRGLVLLKIVLITDKTGELKKSKISSKFIFNNTLVD